MVRRAGHWSIYHNRRSVPRCEYQCDLTSGQRYVFDILLQSFLNRYTVCLHGCATRRDTRNQTVFSCELKDRRMILKHISIDCNDSIDWCLYQHGIPIPFFSGFHCIFSINWGVSTCNPLKSRLRKRHSPSTSKVSDDIDSNVFHGSNIEGSQRMPVLLLPWC